MSLAIGGSSGGGKSPHGTLWADVRDYGAKADNGLTDNSVPFQAAVDALAAQLSTAAPLVKGVVFIPSAPQPYFVAKSVWVDASNIEIQGEGWGSCVQVLNVGSAFIFGIKRVEQTVSNGVTVPVTIDSSHRPDLYGKLDTSAVTAPGTLWGLRTKGDSFAQFQACPLSSGVGDATSKFYSDSWNETSKLTVEFCVEPPDGQLFPTNVPLFSLGSIPDEPSPFTISIWDDPNKVLVMFRTSDMDWGSSNTNRYFTFSLAGASPPYRVAVQFDLANAVCTAFVNGVQAPLTLTVNMSPTSAVPFAPGKGLTFITNDHYPFMIGAQGLLGPFGGPTGIDLRVYGLRLSNTIRYLNRGPSLPQQRADSPSTAINDAYAYFGQDANTICFLRGTDNPATAGRVVTAQHGFGATQGGVSQGVFFNNVYPSWVSENAIRNLFVSGWGGYGQAVCIGNVIEMTVENIRTANAFHGVGSFVVGTNYNVYLSNCSLQGTDAGYFGALQLLHARDVFFGTIGRVAMRHVGCNASWENVFVGSPSPVTEAAFKARGYPYGGNYSIEGMNVDFEGYAFSRAAIICEAHPLANATSLVLRDIFFGTIGSTASLVMLKDLAARSTQLARCWLSVDNMQANTNFYQAAVDLDGPLWYGEVRGVALTGPQIYHRQKWGTAANVLIRDTKYVAPPRAYLWYSGAHALEVRSPADGQFREWRCLATGQYGTPNPPSWAGLTPLSASPNALAAYVLNHAYVTAALS
jgi:hypothetical protein